MSKIIYLDTSAWVKKYFEEKDSNSLKNYLQNNNTIFTSSITYAEMFSVFYRLHRTSEINSLTLNKLIKVFQDDWNSINIVEFNTYVRNCVPKIFQKVTLKGADSIHLTSAFFLKENNLNCMLISFDKKLINAAVDLKIEAPILAD